MRRLPLFMAMVLLPGTWLCAEEIVIESVVLTISEQAEVPAREQGVLAELCVREGQRVKAGELVAQLDDAEARLACDRANLELERAQKLAENDIKVRLATKNREIAQAELERAEEAKRRLEKSVTAAELDRLKLDLQRSSLEAEQAEFELETARLAVRVQANEVQLSIEKARRRRIVSPIAGTVVAVDKRVGEWLEAGQSVVRVIATDRLRAEGFLSAELLSRPLVEQPVQLVVRVPSLREQPFSGKVTFVSPQVDPVTGQARLWAEIDNRRGLLQPGLAGSLTIAP